MSSSADDYVVTEVVLMSSSLKSVWLQAVLMIIIILVLLFLDISLVIMLFILF